MPGTTQRPLSLGRGFKLPLEVVTEATAIVATRGAGKSSAAAVLVEESTASAVPVVLFDWTGVFWGLRSSADGEGPGLGIYVLGGAHGDVPLEPTAGKLIADLVVESGQSFVLDLSDFSKGNMQRFAAEFLERLYERKARQRTTLLVIIDEAHEYAPQTPRGGFKGYGARLMGALEQVVALGRSRGLGAILITQRTQALNKAVLDLIETLIIMRMLSPRGQKAVAEWLKVKHEDDDHGVLASLESLPTGTAWVWAPLRGMLEKVAIRRIKTFDSYATPKPGETALEPSVRKAVDLTALGEQMKATADRAAADDPAALRARIRELESRLKEQAEPAVAEVIEVEYEVPRMPDFVPSRVIDIQGLARVMRDNGQAVLDAVDALRGDVEDIPARSLADFKTEDGRADTRSQVPRGDGRAGRQAEGERGTLGASQAARQEPARPAAVSSRSASGPEPSSNGYHSPARQRILDTLAWFETVGVPAPKRSALAPMAGSKTTSGGFKNNLGALRSAGLIDYPQPNRVQLTGEGAAVADAPETPATVEALQAAVLASLPPARQRIVEVLISVYPNALTREELARRIDVSITSGGFKNNLGALRTLELIDYPDRGLVEALPILFLEDR